MVVEKELELPFWLDKELEDEGLGLVKIGDIVEVTIVVEFGVAEVEKLLNESEEDENEFEKSDEEDPKEPKTIAPLELVI